VFLPGRRAKPTLAGKPGSATSSGEAIKRRGRGRREPGMPGRSGGDVLIVGAGPAGLTLAMLSPTRSSEYGPFIQNTPRQKQFSGFHHTPIYDRRRAGLSQNVTSALHFASARPTKTAPGSLGRGATLSQICERTGPVAVVHRTGMTSCFDRQRSNSKQQSASNGVDHSRFRTAQLSASILIRFGRPAP
jgi:hypothetical protein